MSDEPEVRGLTETLLSDAWAPLKKVEFDYRRRDGRWERQTREVYARGDAATVLPYDPQRGTVLLARQFRLPIRLHGQSGHIIEACAGLLEGDTPEACVRKEAQEELGLRLGEVEFLFHAFMSPGAITERVSFFAATYSPADRIGSGGGEAGEGEDIEVLEMTLEEAWRRVTTGEIQDGKTILLLQHRKLVAATA